jgi:chitin synthase
MLLIEFIYQTINMLFAWFAIVSRSQPLPSISLNFCVLLTVASQGSFFLVFRILTTSLGADELLGTVGKILSVVFEWLYLATLLTSFVLALGNRPQGSNKFYMTMVYFWIGIMIYLSFATVFLTVRSIQHQLANGGFTLSSIFHNQQFFSMIASLFATYVTWLIASLLFFDPWHMFTSVCITLTPTDLVPDADMASSSSNTSFSHPPTSISSTSMHFAIPTISHGVLKVMTKPKSCLPPASNLTVRLMSTCRTTIPT